MLNVYMYIHTYMYVGMYPGFRRCELFFESSGSFSYGDFGSYHDVNHSCRQLETINDQLPFDSE